MKAALLDAPGPPEAIRYGDLPDPTPGSGDVLVRVAAMAVNPIDTYIRSGAYHVELPRPFIVGRDMVGVVVGTGSDVRRFSVGDRVWCNNQGYAGRQGTFAELLAIDQKLLYPLPPTVEPTAAVAVLHSGLTAVTGLARAGIRPGETLFVSGGDGNVGTAVLQLAKAAGARVAVTAGKPEKAQWCTELGADLVIDYHGDVEAALRQFAPAGIDVIWDAAGRIELERAVPLLAHRGRIVLMSGLRRTSPLPIGDFYTRNGTLLGFTVTNATVDELAAAAEQINAALSAGVLRGKIGQTLPLSRAAEGHRLIEEGRLFGKVVIVPVET